MSAFSSAKFMRLLYFLSTVPHFCDDENASVWALQHFIHCMDILCYFKVTAKNNKLIWNFALSHTKQWETVPEKVWCSPYFFWHILNFSLQPTILTTVVSRGIPSWSEIKPTQPIQEQTPLCPHNLQTGPFFKPSFTNPKFKFCDKCVSISYHGVLKA